MKKLIWHKTIFQGTSNANARIGHVHQPGFMNWDSHLGFEVLGGVTWSIVNDLVDVRDVPGKQKHTMGMTLNLPHTSAGLKCLKGICLLILMAGNENIVVVMNIMTMFSLPAIRINDVLYYWRRNDQHNRCKGQVDRSNEERKKKTGYWLALEVWNGEEHLHDRVEVAAVAQVLHPRQAGAIQGTEGGTRLLDHLPFPYTLVHSNLQLCHRPLSLKTAQR